MDVRMNYDRIMNGAHEIALATCADGHPNVRIVNFCHDESRPGIVYFTSDRRNAKVREIQREPRVAFTTVPREGIPHVRAQGAMARVSDRSIDDVRARFLAKIPGFAEAIEAIGADLIVCEIQVREAVLVMGMGAPDVVTFAE